MYDALSSDGVGTAAATWQDVELAMHIVFVLQELYAGHPLSEARGSPRSDCSDERALTTLGEAVSRAVFFPISDELPPPLLQQYFEGRLREKRGEEGQTEKR